MSTNNRQGTNMLNQHAAMKRPHAHCAWQAITSWRTAWWRISNELAQKQPSLQASSVRPFHTHVKAKGCLPVPQAVHVRHTPVHNAGSSTSMNANRYVPPSYLSERKEGNKRDLLQPAHLSAQRASTGMSVNALNTCQPNRRSHSVAILLKESELEFAELADIHRWDLVACVNQSLNGIG